MLVLCMTLCLVPGVGAQGGDEYYSGIADGEWDFKFYEDISQVPEDVTSIVFEDKIQVPGAMELQGYGYPSYYYEEMGGWGQAEDDGIHTVGVYKKVFAPQPMNERFSWVYFSSVRGNMTVYLNGEKIGESRNGDIGSYFQVESNSGEENTLICVVERDNSGINKKDDFSLSGITGDVYFGYASGMYKGKNSKDINIENNRLIVDGEEVVLKGVKYTATHPETGNSITNEQIDKDLALIKEYGFNAIWVSCAPEYFYSKAESLGLYVIDEANVNLSYAERDITAATGRVQAMINRHQEYESIIMWSAGHSDGNAQQLIDTVKKLDNRPVAQEVNFAPEFEVFGNTGGMADWVATLGNGNVGGFVDEFADKELYYIKNAYDFTVNDTATGKKVSIEGEITNYRGVDMLGKGTYTGSVDALDEFTVLTYISNANKDRVLFETEDKSIRLETVNYRIRLTVNGRSIDADGGEGKVAAVYADGEMQLFTSRSFKSNMECDVKLKGGYTVGEGNGAVGIEYVKLYNDMLTIDELVDMSAEDKCISSVEFKDIDIKKDNSYRFLAYGGDFGDEPNSYYKCLTGLFTSTREPHPEAEAFKALFENKTGDEIKVEYMLLSLHNDMVKPTENESGFVFEASGNKITIDREGRITSIQKRGSELLEGAIYPIFVRENTLYEYEMSVENEDRWEAVNAEVKGLSLYVTLKSRKTNAMATIRYAMFSGYLYVSVQAEFADGATSPTFIGFRGAGKFDEVEWYGYETSSYPDRKAGGEVSLFKKSVSDMGDNYAVPQENGNKEVSELGLIGENGNLVFKSASEYDTLQIQVLDYSPEAMENADRDEDIVKDGNTYFRVGGFIKGLSDDSKYALSENVYGYNFYIGTDVGMSRMDAIQEIFVDGEELTAFAPHVETYVYRTNEPVKVTFEGNDALQDDKKAVCGHYTVYFAPDTEYMSDMTAKEKNAEIALDKDFNGAKITMRGNDYWAPSVSYDKGVALKGGSVTYDVSAFGGHVFNAVVGKNDFDWRSMGGGFDRNMFDAAATVTIALDGVVVEEIKDISMRSGSREVNIDVSNAKEMTITVTGNGRAPQYEDVVLANAAFVPDGPIVLNFEKKDGKATITVLNTDEEYVDVVLTATGNGIITTEATSIGKGLYRTVDVKAGDNAFVKAYITGIGEITID